MMMHTALRVNKGLFECQNVLGSVECDRVKKILEQKEKKGEFTEKPHEEDDGIDEHPLWLERFPPSIQAKIHKYINLTDIPSLFGFEDNKLSLDQLTASFVLIYRRSEKSNRKKLSLSLHNDKPLQKDRHVLSVVYTIKSDDCVGGTVEYANKNDGTAKESKNLTKYQPKHNSIYCMNGDFVSHCTYGVDSGVRFSVVLFYNTPQLKIDVVALWTQFPKEFICVNCYHGFRERKLYKDHLNGICHNCNACCMRRRNLIKHVC